MPRSVDPSPRGHPEPAPVDERPLDAPAPDPGGADGPAADEALEASRLLLELVHVVYATRAAEAEAAGEAHGPSALTPGAARTPPSTHAIRAAVHVHQHGVRTVGELAEGLGISYGWASRVVTELEQSGMIERHVDPADRRVVRVSLTPEAAAMVERTYRWRGEAIERALADLDAHERAAVRTFLRQVIEELGHTVHDRRA